MKNVKLSLLLTLLLSSVILCSCKGRRATDMVPTGDTVEVGGWSQQEERVMDHEKELMLQTVDSSSLPEDEAI